MHNARYCTLEDCLATVRDQKTKETHLAVAPNFPAMRESDARKYSAAKGLPYVSVGGGGGTSILRKLNTSGLNSVVRRERHAHGRHTLNIQFA